MAFAKREALGGLHKPFGAIGVFFEIHCVFLLSAASQPIGRCKAAEIDNSHSRRFKTPKASRHAAALRYNISAAAKKGVASGVRAASPTSPNKCAGPLDKVYDMLSFLTGLFRRRDKEIYPDNEFGDELFRAFSNPDQIPPEAYISFDCYFDSEGDADAMETYFLNRRADTMRDRDDEPDEEFGPWNVEGEFKIKPTHREIAATVAQIRDVAHSCRGKVAFWDLSIVDPE